VANLLRQRTLAKLFGDGLTGAAAAAAFGWFIDQARDAARKDPERLDVSQLRPGETYLVTTRPAMNRAERRLDQQASKLSARVERDARPSRAARRTARRLAKGQRRLDSATPGSRRAAKRQVRVDVLGSRVNRQVALTQRQRRRADQSDDISRQRAELRDRSIESARKKARPPRSRRFT